MKTIYLAFPDKGTSESAMRNAQWVDEDGNPQAPEGYQWDVIGGIMLAPPPMNSEGEPIGPSVKDDRYHVNVYCLAGGDVPEHLAVYSVDAPGTPLRALVD